MDPPHQGSPEDLDAVEIPGNPGVAPKGTIRREARTGDLQDHRPRPRPVEGPRRWRVASDEPLAEARSPPLQLHEPPGGHKVSPEAFSPRPAEEDPHLVALTLPAVLSDDEGRYLLPRPHEVAVGDDLGSDGGVAAVFFREDSHSLLDDLVIFPECLLGEDPDHVGKVLILPEHCVVGVELAPDAAPEEGDVGSQCDPWFCWIKITLTTDQRELRGCPVSLEDISRVPNVSH